MSGGVGMHSCGRRCLPARLFAAGWPGAIVVGDGFDVAGHFLLLGSASCDVLEHSTETLAGRIWHLELSPLSIPEVYQHDPQGIEVDKL